MSAARFLWWCSHPQLLLDAYEEKLRCREPIDDSLAALVALIPPPQTAAAPAKKGNDGANASSVLSRYAARSAAAGLNTHAKPLKGKGAGRFDPELSGTTRP